MDYKPHLFWGGVAHGKVVIPESRRVDVVVADTSPLLNHGSRVAKLSTIQKIGAKLFGLTAVIDRFDPPSYSKVTYHAVDCIVPPAFVVRLMVQNPMEQKPIDETDFQWIRKKHPSVIGYIQDGHVGDVPRSRR